jgi:hypothetical protein
MYGYAMFWEGFVHERITGIRRDFQLPSLGLLVVLVIHLVLHWNWIVTVFGKHCHMVKSPHPSLLRSGILTSCMVILAATLFAWTAQNSIKAIARPMRGGEHWAQIRQHNEPVAPIEEPVKGRSGSSASSVLERCLSGIWKPLLTLPWPAKTISQF